jgi:hypothetical protein
VIRVDVVEGESRWRAVWGVMSCRRCRGAASACENVGKDKKQAAGLLKSSAGRRCAGQRPIGEARDDSACRARDEAACGRLELLMSRLQST